MVCLLATESITTTCADIFAFDDGKRAGRTPFEVGFEPLGLCLGYMGMTVQTVGYRRRLVAGD